MVLDQTFLVWLRCAETTHAYRSAFAVSFSAGGLPTGNAMTQTQDDELLMDSEDVEEPLASKLGTMTPSQPGAAAAAGHQDSNDAREDEDQLASGCHEDGGYLAYEDELDQGDAGDAAAASNGAAGLDTASAGVEDADATACAGNGGQGSDDSDHTEGQKEAAAAADQPGVASKPPAVSKSSAPRNPLHSLSRKRPPADAPPMAPRRLPPLLRGPPPRFPPNGLHGPPPPHWLDHRPPSPPHYRAPPPPAWQQQHEPPPLPLRQPPPPAWQQLPPSPRGFRQPEPPHRGPPHHRFREPTDPYMRDPYMDGPDLRPPGRAPYRLHDQHSPPPPMQPPPPPMHADRMRAPYRFSPEADPYLDPPPHMRHPELPPRQAPYRVWEDEPGPPPRHMPPPMQQQAPAGRYGEPPHPYHGPPALPPPGARGPPPGAPYRCGPALLPPRAPYMTRP